jgi:divalent metal cation (Fe/Co/Zn/Cd) transporter
LFSIYEGWHKLQHPEPLNQVWVALVVLALAVVLESTAMFGVLREIRHLRKDKPLKYWLKTTRNAELVVVLGEDFAALIGLTLAFICLSLAALTGNPLYDAIGSICIGVVLVTVSMFVAIRIRDLIIGKSAAPDLRSDIDELINDDPNIERVFNVITFQMGPQVMLAAKIHLQPQLPVGEAVTIINRLERRLKENHPQIGWCFIEPDDTD